MQDAVGTDEGLLDLLAELRHRRIAGYGSRVPQHVFDHGRNEVARAAQQGVEEVRKRVVLQVIEGLGAHALPELLTFAAVEVHPDRRLEGALEVVHHAREHGFEALGVLLELLPRVGLQHVLQAGAGKKLLNRIVDRRGDEVGDGLGGQQVLEANGVGDVVHEVLDGGVDDALEPAPGLVVLGGVLLGLLMFDQAGVHVEMLGLDGGLPDCREVAVVNDVDRNGYAHTRGAVGG